MEPGEMAEGRPDAPIPHPPSAGTSCHSAKHRLQAWETDYLPGDFQRDKPASMALWCQLQWGGAHGCGVALPQSCPADKIGARSRGHTHTAADRVAMATQAIATGGMGGGRCGSHGPPAQARVVGVRPRQAPHREVGAARGRRLWGEGAGVDLSGPARGDVGKHGITGMRQSPRVSPTTTSPQEVVTLAWTSADLSGGNSLGVGVLNPHSIIHECHNHQTRTQTPHGGPSGVNTRTGMGLPMFLARRGRACLWRQWPSAQTTAHCRRPTYPPKQRLNGSCPHMDVDVIFHQTRAN